MIPQASAAVAAAVAFAVAPLRFRLATPHPMPPMSISTVRAATERTISEALRRAALAPSGGAAAAAAAAAFVVSPPSPPCGRRRWRRSSGVEGDLRRRRVIAVVATTKRTTATVPPHACLVVAPPSRASLSAGALRRPFGSGLAATATTTTTTLRRMSTYDDGGGDDEGEIPPLPMENLYAPWTIEQDRTLYENRNEPLPRLASLLGRGLVGVRSRLDKLLDVDSAAYGRLFADDGDGTPPSREPKKGGGLTPASEVLRRIRWDGTLNGSDFVVRYYDRVDDATVETPFDAVNDSVAGNEERFVFALPEHRISAVLYKERIVWDKDRRIDLVFGSMNGKGTTIYEVVEGYERWIRGVEEEREARKDRQREVAKRVKAVLGEDRFEALKGLSSELQSESLELETEVDARGYVREALALFRSAAKTAAETTASTADPDRPPAAVGDAPPDGESGTASAQTDPDSLDLLSELVAVLPDDAPRETVLSEIERRIRTLERQASSSEPDRDARKKSGMKHPNALPKIDEDELTEKFVRGSGAGGQKVNKTANRVVLVHDPTGLRVECQDTRSLSQNRKIARKRLRLKLDELRHGGESRIQTKAANRAKKKSRAKARNKARRRKKMEARAEEEGGTTTATTTATG